MDKNNKKIDGWCSHCGASMECTFLVEKCRIKGKKDIHIEFYTLICEDCKIRNTALNFSKNNKKLIKQ